ncbi:hypothetical protein PAECIP111891_06153 [Paenibacillus allorhizoplanae]|uniref:Uncharacterized protein n=1 Tax=Paenibacillus allorhizoplanae TaxID=2905648 RepID=A0ABM9CYL9_9BACL|nr:hypothetical protein PAECIP111891_06153 [Paenibacillus allorhizoplanae]
MQMIVIDAGSTLSKILTLPLIVRRLGPSSANPPCEVQDHV